jgi:hypothetical protein
MLYLNHKEAFQALDRFATSLDVFERLKFVTLATKVREMVVKGWGGVEVDEGFLDAVVVEQPENFYATEPTPAPENFYMKKEDPFTAFAQRTGFMRALFSQPEDLVRYNVMGALFGPQRV